MGQFYLACLGYGPVWTRASLIAFMDKAAIPREVDRSGSAIDTSKAFPCFALPKDAEPITLEQVLEAEDG